MIETIYTEENGEYLQKNPTWHVEDSPWKAEQLLKIINANHLQPNSIAEVGCGAGEILNQLYLSMPGDVLFTGYDISVDAINLAKHRKKERLVFKHENFLDTNTQYDLLIMMDVFEHVNDYLGFLKQCKNRAKHTIFHIPLDLSVSAIMRNKLIDGRKSVGHLHYFMKETALATLVDSGYDVIDFFYTTGSLDLPLKNFRSKLAVLPRRLLYTINQDMAAKLVGGFSLLVLTK
ncbi:class I SAM-dependent methyltransferase [Larkinella humicola]|uniref:Class I SAM-dependent methyltransferase n=1 Tax=Larkinella humicola TaxID=2607654 RepID=A0A5N1JAS6_9BACT|nr:methyltransferase domain-containing protein [Larkinella humicola]KAA9349458.1 class I SAM-dependent methyltransferase [Larkinella humicola]